MKNNTVRIIEPNIEDPRQVRKEIQEYMRPMERQIYEDVRELFAIRFCQQADIDSNEHYYIVSYEVEDTEIEETHIGRATVIKHIPKARATLYIIENEYQDRDGYTHRLAKLKVLRDNRYNHSPCYYEMTIDVRPLLSDIYQDLYEENNVKDVREIFSLEL